MKLKNANADTIEVTIDGKTKTIQSGEEFEVEDEDYARKCRQEKGCEVVDKTVGTAKAATPETIPEAEKAEETKEEKPEAEPKKKKKKKLF